MSFISSIMSCCTSFCCGTREEDQHALVRREIEGSTHGTNTTRQPLSTSVASSVSDPFSADHPLNQFFAQFPTSPVTIEQYTRGLSEVQIQRMTALGEQYAQKLLGEGNT